MAPRTAKQFKEIRKEKKNLIMKVGLELFANEGYHSTSISKIAKAANISKGLMYNYFVSKEDLLKQISIEGINKEFEAFDFFDPHREVSLTKEEFITLIQEFLMGAKKQINFWKLYFSLMAQPHVLAVLGDDFMSSFDSYFKIISAYFKSQGFKDGYAETRFFIAILDGIALHYIVDPEHFPYEKAIERVINIYA